MIRMINMCSPEGTFQPKGILFLQQSCPRFVGIVDSVRCNPVLCKSDVVPDLSADLYPHFPKTQGSYILTTTIL